jgi:hypothetical protein
MLKRLAQLPRFPGDSGRFGHNAVLCPFTEEHRYMAGVSRLGNARELGFEEAEERAGSRA